MNGGPLLALPEGVERVWAVPGDLLGDTFASTTSDMRRYKRLIAAEQLDGETAKAFDIDSDFMATRRWEYGYAVEMLWQSYGRTGGSPLRVLDVGCGYRPFTLFLASLSLRLTESRRRLVAVGEGRTLEVWALDNESWETKEPLADRLAPRGIHFVHGDMTAMTFAGEMFDAVFAISVFEHLLREDLQSALSECLRVLRPGGILVATVDACQKVKALVPEGEPPADVIRTQGGRPVAGCLVRKVWRGGHGSA